MRVILVSSESGWEGWRGDAATFCRAQMSGEWGDVFMGKIFLFFIWMCGARRQRDHGLNYIPGTKQNKMMTGNFRGQWYKMSMGSISSNKQVKTKMRIQLFNGLFNPFILNELNCWYAFLILEMCLWCLLTAHSSLAITQCWNKYSDFMSRNNLVIKA